MPSETGIENRRPTTMMTTAAAITKTGAPPAPGTDQLDHPLPCPRCDSTNTKFCYYNNYNFSQPRHFCKSCRRYWTHGGALRDIPVGGATRRNAKRPRIYTPASSGSLDPITSTPLFMSLSAGVGVGVGPGGGGGGAYVEDLLNVKPGVGPGGFSNLISGVGQTAGFLALGGFGLGLGLGNGIGLEDVGFGLGRGVWPFPEVGYLGGGGLGGDEAVGGGVDHGQLGTGNTWQLESGAENGVRGWW